MRERGHLILIIELAVSLWPTQGKSVRLAPGEMTEDRMGHRDPRCPLCLLSSTPADTLVVYISRTLLYRSSNEL